jgi:hypothetical protein
LSAERLRLGARTVCLLIATAPVAISAVACQDLGNYSTTATAQYAGCVVPAGFVLSGMSPTAALCLTLDAQNLQTSPGTLTSSDGRFVSTPLRPIPQIWNDPLSTLTFGEGRVKNLIYAATPVTDGQAEGDVMVVVSLMNGGNVEVRLLRGAPPLGAADGSSGPTAPNVFAVFPLTMQSGTCASLVTMSCTPDAG